MGRLELIIGPMFSGKTSLLIQLYNEAILKHDDVLGINYDKDIRYSKTHIVSHDQQSMPSVNVNQLIENPRM